MHALSGRVTPLSRASKLPSSFSVNSALKSGRAVVEDLPRSGQPSTSSTEVNIAKVKEMVTENCHLSLREIAAKLSVSHELIRTILNDLWKENSWILHHDNAPSHKVIIVNEFMAKNSTNIIEQPPYSPDMAPADFFLFPKHKSLRGTRLQSIEDMKENSWRILKSIPTNAFKKCFDDWIICWYKCIISGGAYFEGDKINLDE